jgi:serine/threonine-protein kinase RsbW
LSWLRFSIQSKLDEIFLVSLVVRQVCTHFRVDEIVGYQIELCTVEAVTNAIRHAYHQKADNEVTVLMQVSEEQIDLEIQDFGDSMDPKYIERLRAGCEVLNFDPTDLESLPESGMGLQIMHEVMDEATYTSDGTINRLMLSKRIQR